MCRLLSEARRLRVSVNRSAAEAYRVLSASAGDWLAGTAGSAIVDLTDPNDLGVLDYSLTPRGGGPATYVPLRVVGSGRGCELVLTLFGQANLTAEQALRQLVAAKRLIEPALTAAE